MSDAVGEMAEKESGTTLSGSSAEAEPQGTVLKERASDEPPNPKKRMWEETTAAQEDSRPRDEL